ncbi:MAG: hypothetical protein M3N10_10665 [Actinomycetota bacterium]|nr:hypothetical protein [Actinomycetota bacterium]HZY66593.1 hypothetical protein [Rubrobacteraceae bacterium]
MKAKRRFKLHALSVLAALVIAAFVAGCGSSETIGGGQGDGGGDGGGTFTFGRGLTRSASTP